MDKQRAEKIAELLDQHIYEIIYIYIAPTRHAWEAFYRGSLIAEGQEKSDVKARKQAYAAIYDHLEEN